MEQVMDEWSENEGKNDWNLDTSHNSVHILLHNTASVPIV